MVGRKRGERDVDPLDGDAHAHAHAHAHASVPAPALPRRYGTSSGGNETVLELVIHEPSPALEPRLGDGGRVTRYSVSPSLPHGLELNVFSGMISGMPLQLASRGTYTICAENTGGRSRSCLSIAVRSSAVLVWLSGGEQ